jgi:tetratricopeptide (TPR) repeat protein
MTLNTEHAIKILQEGYRLQQQKRWEEALEHYDQVLTMIPDFADVMFMKSIAYYQLKDKRASLDWVQRAIQKKPQDANFKLHEASVLMELGREKDSRAAVDQVLKMSGNHAPALYQRGVQFELNTEYQKALLTYNMVLEVDPKHLHAKAGKAWMLFNLGKAEEAFPIMQSVVQENATVSAWQLNLGVMYKHQQEYDQAMMHFKRAVELDPNMFAAYYNQGVIYMDLAQFDKAHAILDTVIARGDQGAGRYYKCMLYFLEGKISKALEFWDWRFRHVDAPLREWPFPRWKGEPLPAGKKLLLWAEQGIGDELMFAGLLPQFLEKNIPVVVEASKRLVPLFERSFDIEIAPRSLEGCKRLVHDPDIAFQAPIGDLLYHAMPKKDYPLRSGYLKADAALTELFRMRYAALGEGPKVGISWYSSNYSTGGQRSIALEDWLPVLSVPNIRWVSVQYGDKRAEVEAFTKKHGIPIHWDETVDAMQDMDRFAAQVASLDMVVSVANSTVHMAGSMGIPVWVLLPEVPSWRWQMHTDDAIWYPHIKLFRQKKMYVWRDAIEAMASALNNKK